MWLLTIFGKLVCYETTPLVTETIPFVMDCKLQRVDREPGKYSSRPGLVVVQYVTSSSTYVDWERHMPLLICLGLDNYTHVQTVDTRPSFLGQVGPRSEARKCKTSRNRERCFVPPPRTQQLCGQRPSRLYHSTLWSLPLMLHTTPPQIMLIYSCGRRRAKLPALFVGRGRASCMYWTTARWLETSGIITRGMMQSLRDCSICLTKLSSLQPPN